MDWIHYKCKSGKTLFIYNKATGEHKWPNGVSTSTPVQYNSVGTQTDDYGCENGCSSMYINTDPFNTCSRLGASNKTVSTDSPQENCQDKLNNVVFCDSEQDFENELDLEKSSDSEDEEDKNHCFDEIPSMVKVFERSMIPCANNVYRNDIVKAKHCVIDNNVKQNGNHCGNDGKISRGNDRMEFQITTDYTEGNNESDCSHVYNHDINAEADLNGEIQQSYEDESGRFQREELPHKTILIKKEKEVYCYVDNNAERYAEILSHHGQSDETESGGFQSEELPHGTSVDYNIEIIADSQQGQSIENDLGGFQNKELPYQSNFIKNGEDGHSSVDNYIKVNAETEQKQSKSTRIKKSTQFVCSYCNKPFTQRSHLNRHLRGHTGEKPFECSFCGKKFAEKGYVRSHMRTHTGEKPYGCTFCEKRFSLRSTFRDHLRTHTGERPFKCSYCEKTYTQKTHLREHLLKHTGSNKLIQCPQCEKRFTKERHLIDHLKIHSGWKPFKCTYCDMKFSHRGNLNRHIRTHTGEKPYECSCCGKKFGRSTYLKIHLKKTCGEK